MLPLALILAQTCEPFGEFVCRSAEQTIGGHKTFSAMSLHTASYPVGGIGVGVYSPSGVATRAVLPANDGEGVVLIGRRGESDAAGNVIIKGKHWRPGAYAMCVNSPDPCDTPAFCVADNADVHFGWGTSQTCASDPAAGSIVDRSTSSGHISLRREPGYYLAMRGALGAREDATNPNGSAPECPGPYTRQTDNGCRYNYAGGHGDVDLGSAYPMRAGFLLEIYNPLSGVGARTDHRAYWDWNGAYSQNHGLTLAQFPLPQQVEVSTNLGKFYFEAAPGALYYAHDTKHWYHAAGTHWAQLAEQAEVDARLALIEARLAALEATCP